MAEEREKESPLPYDSAHPIEPPLFWDRANISATFRTLSDALGYLQDDILNWREWFQRNQQYINMQINQFNYTNLAEFRGWVINNTFLDGYRVWESGHKGKLEWEAIVEKLKISLSSTTGYLRFDSPIVTSALSLINDRQDSWDNPVKIINSAILEVIHRRRATEERVKSLIQDSKSIDQLGFIDQIVGISTPIIESTLKANISHSISEEKERIESLKNKIDSLEGNLNNDVQAILTTVRDAQAFEDAYKGWADAAARARLIANWLFTAFGVLAVGAAIWFWCVGIPHLHKIGSGDLTSGSLILRVFGSAELAVVGGLAIWIMRVIVRSALEARSRSVDNLGRVNAVKAFLGLQSVAISSISEKEREVMFKAMFEPTKAASIDDAAPSADAIKVMELAAKLAKQGTK